MKDKRRTTTLQTLAAKHSIEVWGAPAWDLECGSCAEVRTVDSNYMSANTYRAELDGASMVRCPECGAGIAQPDPGTSLGRKWFYWTCMPGCLPESEAWGPYDSEREALLAAVEGLDD